ncbi:MAG: RNA-binding protein [Phycisphaerales bacterium]
MTLELKPGEVGIVNIYVGNLPFSTTEAELQNEFGQFGTVTRAQVMIDRDTGRSRGFGFVEMANDDEARKAIEALNGKDMNGRPLTVNEARPREERPRSGGGWGGGGGGGGRSGGGGGGWGGGGGGGGGGRGGWGGGGGGGGGGRGGRGGDRGDRGGRGGGGGGDSW